MDKATVSGDTLKGAFLARALKDGMELGLAWDAACSLEEYILGLRQEQQAPEMSSLYEVLTKEKG